MADQRLPIVNSDDGTWGEILRQYLLKEHYNADADLAQSTSENGGHKTVTIQPGTASAGTAPLKFASGTLLTTPEAGAVEFNSDRLYFTKTTGPTRQAIATYDATGSTGDVYYRDSGSNFVRLPIGSTGTVLTVASGVPSWSNAVTLNNASTVTLQDTSFTLQDDGDNTKQLQFNLSAISASTTRTISVPNVNGTMYVSSGTDVAVADGGTGRSSHTTYGLIAGGTTTTGAQQSITNGASGTFLKSAGASALATWASIQLSDLSDASSVATLTGAQALTNKNMTSGTNTWPTFNQNTTGNAATATTATNQSGGTVSATTGDFSSYLRTDEVRNLSGTQLVLNAGESHSQATGQSGELIYLNAENGVQINTSPDNWSSSWAGRVTTTIDNTGITWNGNTVWHAGNDGASSGLDADTLDGQQASAFAASSHTHAAANISDSTSVGRSVLTAVDAAAARTAIGAGTGTGDVTLTGSQTLTNKTISGSSNTITNIAQSSVTNLTTDLAGKASTSHTHTAANISDSTATGRSVLTAVDAAAARTAIGAGTGSGDVTLAGAQTLTNKTISGSSNTFTNIPTSAISSLTATASELNILDGVTATTAELNYVDGVTSNVQTQLNAKAATSHTHTATNISDSTATGRSVLTATDAAAARSAIGAGTGNGDVTLNGAQTLTNKIINLSSNTLSGTTAQFNAALSDNDFATVTDIANKADVAVMPAGDILRSTPINTHPESAGFSFIPMIHNDIAFNHLRGGSVAATLNGSPISPSNNYFMNAGHTSIVPTASTDSLVLDVTLCQTFSYGTYYGIVMNDSFIAHNVTIEIYFSGAWTQIYTATTTAGDPPGRGIHWKQYGANGANAVSRIRYTLTDIPNLSSGVRINSLFAIGYASPLATVGFLPRNGGDIYGTTAAPPTLSANGGDANIDLRLVSKGTGVVKANNIEVATISDTQTLTNKTFTTPVINGTVTGTGVATAATASTLVIRDSNGDFTGRYIMSTYVNMSHSASARNSDTVFYSSTDAYIRKNTAAGFKTSLALENVDNTSDATKNSASATLTNKTISGADNTFTNISAGAISGLTATVSELNILDGVTATASELNRLDGITATTAELNYVDGVTSNVQTQLNAKAATSHTHTATNISDSTATGRSVLTATDAAAARSAIGAGTGNGDVTLAGAQALTNKRITSRVTTITSSATPAINTDNCDAVTITALATNITSMTTSLTGSPNNFDKLMVRIKDNGSSRTIAWGASFQNSGAGLLPTATVAGKTFHVGLIYDSVISKWVCIAVDSAGY